MVAIPRRGYSNDLVSKPLQVSKIFLLHTNILKITFFFQIDFQQNKITVVDSSCV